MKNSLTPNSEPPTSYAGFPSSRLFSPVSEPCSVFLEPCSHSSFSDFSFPFSDSFGFNGQEKDDEIYGEGASYTAEFWQYDSRLGRRWNVEPLAKDFPWISSYAVFSNNPNIFIDPDGKKIVLTGTATERQTILTNLQNLTNDKLSLRSDGTVIIVKMGGENSGKALTSGSELIRDLNKKGDGARTVTISISNNNPNGSHEYDVTPADAINGVGSDAIVVFDLSQNPSNIPTKDPVTGNVSGQSMPYEIALGHELIHADRSMKGVAIDYSIRTTHTYKDANGNTVTQTKPQEELETVGLQGTHKYNENKLRKEQGLDERGAY